MIIRPATPADLPTLMDMSATLPPGMTSMPVDEKTWQNRLELVQESLRGAARLDRESVYLLVLEDPAVGDVVGTAGIVAGVGLKQPFYNYKLSRESRYSEQLDIHTTSTLLNLVNDFCGDTEMTSLFLRPEYRRNYCGRFLSRCRYLFMSDFPERFSNTVFAEIRGWLNENNSSPFWEHLGRKFFKLPFDRADFISAVNGPGFISDLMPRHPIYLELLPEEATRVIGKPHDGAAPAKTLLEAEGFAWRDCIDIFDGGPVMECELSSIKSIRDCRTLRVRELIDKDNGSNDSALCMLSNRNLDDYRIIMARAPDKDSDEIVIQRDQATDLNVDVGSEVQCLLMGAPGRNRAKVKVDDGKT